MSTTAEQLSHYTTADELADALDELAAEIRQSGITGEFNAKVDLWFHRCDREALRAIARMMRCPEQRQYTGTHWAADDRGAINLNAHFDPGILGQVEREVVREVVTTEVTIADLLAEEPTP